MDNIQGKCSQKNNPMLDIIYSQKLLKVRILNRHLKIKKTKRRKLLLLVVMRDSFGIQFGSLTSLLRTKLHYPITHVPGEVFASF